MRKQAGSVPILLAALVPFSACEDAAEERRRVTESGVLKSAKGSDESERDYSADGVRLVLDQGRGEEPCDLRIRRTRIVLGPDHEGTIPDPGFEAVMDPQGRFVTTTRSPGELAVWSEEGKFEHTVGRLGEGPDEFQRVRSLERDRAGRVHVLQWRGRWSILGPDLEMERLVISAPLSAADSDAAVLGDGRLVVSGGVPGAEDRMLHVLGIDGTVEHSFHPREARIREGRPNVDHPDRFKPAIVRAFRSDSEFWAGLMEWDGGGYVLERFDADGTRTGVVQRTNADWMTDHGPLDRFNLSVYDEGVVRVSLYFLPPGANAGEGILADDGVTTTRYDEVLSIRHGRVLASAPSTEISDKDIGISGDFPFTGKGFTRTRRELGLMNIEIINVVLHPRTAEAADLCRAPAPGS